MIDPDMEIKPTDTMVPMALQAQAEEAKKMYLESHMTIQEIALMTDLPANVIMRLASGLGWKKLRRAMAEENQSRADESLLSILQEKRLTAANRHLDLAKKLEDRAEEVLDQGGVSTGELRRIAEILTHSSNITSRAVGLDISMTKDAVESVRPQDQKATKAPLVYIDLTPRKANDTREEDAAPAIDVKPTNETEGVDR